MKKETVDPARWLRNTNFKRCKKKQIVTVQKTGQTVFIRKHKCKPKGCSTPRQICLVCLVTVIRKNSALYDGKVCSGCLAKGLGPLRVTYVTVLKRGAGRSGSAQ